jgi:hypothetical protein
MIAEDAAHNSEDTPPTPLLSQGATEAVGSTSEAKEKENAGVRHRIAFFEQKSLLNSPSSLCHSRGDDQGENLRSSIMNKESDVIGISSPGLVKSVVQKLSTPDPKKTCAIRPSLTPVDSSPGLVKIRMDMLAERARGSPDIHRDKRRRQCEPHDPLLPIGHQRSPNPPCALPSTQPSYTSPLPPAAAPSPSSSHDRVLPSAASPPAQQTIPQPLPILPSAMSTPPPTPADPAPPISPPPSSPAPSPAHLAIQSPAVPPAAPPPSPSVAAGGGTGGTGGYHRTRSQVPATRSGRKRRCPDED